jgi:AraC-like DNA-binding protein
LVNSRHLRKPLKTLNQWDSMQAMLCEHSTLAAVPRLLAETLEADYGIDPSPLLARAGVDAATFLRPGARVPYPKILRLWGLAVDATADPLFGFRVGERSAPRDFYVLGYSWMASATFYDALERFCRYVGVVSTAATGISLQQYGETVALIETFPDRSLIPHKAANDAGHVAFAKLCQTVTRRDVHPVSVELMIEKDDSSGEYEKLFRCPIIYGAESEKLYFARADVEEPLPGSVPEILDVSDDTAERYLATLDRASVSAAVRKQILQLLPSGHADQSTVAEKLYRSRSTLQRELRAEGTSFRAIQDSTKRNLAERYLRDRKLSQAEIAFLTGFGDQSNFSRAFKRWVGVTPGDYRKQAETAAMSAT